MLRKLLNVKDGRMKDIITTVVRDDIGLREMRRVMNTKERKNVWSISSGISIDLLIVYKI